MDEIGPNPIALSAFSSCVCNECLSCVYRLSRDTGTLDRGIPNYMANQPRDIFVKLLLEMIPSPPHALYSFTFTVSHRKNSFRFGKDVLDNFIHEDSEVSTFFGGYTVKQIPIWEKYQWNRLSLKAQEKFLEIWLKTHINNIPLKFVGFIEVSRRNAVHAHLICWHPAYSTYYFKYQAELVDLVKRVNLYFNPHSSGDVCNRVTDLPAWLDYISKDYPVSRYFTNLTPAECT